MALRQALKLRAFQPLLGGRAFSGVPKVSDKMVRLVVVDQEGHRHAVRGVEGSSLAKALKENCPGISPDVFFQQPLSSGGYDAHVTVTNDWVQELPTISTEEKDTLWECAKDVSGKASAPRKTHGAAMAVTNSRLASSVVLSGDMDGMTVAIGKLSPWQTL